MPTIGKRAHAAEMAEWFYNHSDDYSYGSDWEELGGGCSRTAYLHKPTGVVYKLEDGYDNYRAYTNSNELRHAKTLWKESDNGHIGRYIKIPMTTGFNLKVKTGRHKPKQKLVLAQEHAESSGREPSDGARLALYRLGFEDMHHGNFAVLKTGRIMPFDLASTRYRKDNWIRSEWSEGPDMRALSGSKYYDIEYKRRYG